MNRVMTLAASTVVLGLAACNGEEGLTAGTQDGGATGTIEWTAAGDNNTYAVSGGYAAAVTEALHRIMIEANPPGGPPTRHGPTLSIEFSLIGSRSGTVQSGVVAYDPRGPGTGWWARQGRGPGAVEIVVDEVSLKDGKLSLSGRVEGELEPRGDQDKLQIRARFKTGLKIIE